MKTDVTATLRAALTAYLRGFRGPLLDVGCGSGDLTCQLTRGVDCAVGIDPDSDRIARALTFSAQPTLSFLVCRAEAPCFSRAFFEVLLFCQSLHHIPIRSQLAALIEAHRLLTENGRLIIIEPRYGKGTYGGLIALTSDEKEAKESALSAVASLQHNGFRKIAEKEIRIECTCSGYDDFYSDRILPKPELRWSPEDEQKVRRILDSCERSPDNDIILDYYAAVFVFEKTSGKC